MTARWTWWTQEEDISVVVNKFVPKSQSLETNLFGPKMAEEPSAASEAEEDKVQGGEQENGDEKEEEEERLENGDVHEDNSDEDERFVLVILVWMGLESVWESL